VNEKQSASQPKQRRRYYDEEFKRSAVELLERGERSAVQLSRELGISDCALGIFLLRSLRSFAAILFATTTEISLANPSLAHTFPALYAKGDCKTQNEESSGEAL
jgi:hypothetical protein